MTSFLRRYPPAAMWLVWAGCALAGLILPRAFPVVGFTDQWLADVRLGALAPRMEQRDDIVIFTITEETLARYPYRFPIDRGLLADAIDRFNRANVRAIGLDILFDQPTEPEKDWRLADAVRASTAPVVIGWAGQDGALTARQRDHLATYLTEAVQAPSNLTKSDRDGTVRWLYPGTETAQGFRRAFAPALAEAFGVAPPRVTPPIFYRRALDGDLQPFKKFPLHLVDALPPHWYAGKIVLIGADLPNEDRHRTPFAALVGDRQASIPGVVIHAHVLAQIIDGVSLAESGPWQETLVTAVAAALGVLVVIVQFGAAARVALGATSLLAIWVAGFGIFWLGGPLTPIFAPSLTLAAATGISTAIAAQRNRRSRQYAEAMVRRRTQSLHNVVETSFNGIVVTDPDGIVTTVNPAATRIMRWDPDFVVGRPIDAHFRDAEAIRSRFCDYVDVETGMSAATAPMETEVDRADGGEFVAEVFVTTARMSFDTPVSATVPTERISYVFTFQDVTERRRAQDAQKRALEEVQAANRAKSEFLANMNHELRTPLNAVIGFSDIMRSEALGPLGEEYRTYAYDIHESGVHLLEIINDILSMSKIVAGNLELTEESVDLAGAIRACVRMIDERARLGEVAIVVEAADDRLTVRADEQLLKQMILNLLSNAVKFTPKGGCATIAVDAGNDGTLIIAVIDTGIGIDPADIERVLAPFGQVDGRLQREFEGTGLGLPLVKAMIEAHGGELKIDSVLNKGTTVSLVMPAGRIGHIAPAPSAAARPAEAVEAGVERRLRVLVAEDNHANQLLIQALLEAAGHVADFANNGLEAIDALGEQVYDVVLMDIHMPLMDGVAATHRIRAVAGRSADIPIIAVTASAAPEDRHRFIAAGMNDLVAKPIDPKSLYRAIAKQCGLPSSNEPVAEPKTNVKASITDIGQSSANHLDELCDLLDGVIASTD